MKKNQLFLGKQLLLLALILVLSLAPALAERFRYKYTEGESYRILSSVQENVFFNNNFSHYAEVVNRISAKVTKVEGNSAQHEAVFMVTESTSGRQNEIPVWGEEYLSVFMRDELGFYDIEKTYFMPVVRDVPVFPDKDVQVGESWTAEGHEAHDLRRSFDIPEPWIVPFSARYTYTGTVEEEGRTLHVIEVRYNIYYDSPRVKNKASLTSDLPATTMGYSHQTLYWDNEKGALSHYNEDFRILIETVFGNTYEFQGIAQAEVTDFVTPSVDKLAEVQQSIQDLGLEDVSLRKDEDGLTISIENIQFKADSAILMESEKVKLQKIADILLQFPDNDLMVSGHTALAGTAGARLKLSQERAKSVAEYLVQLGVRHAHQIFTQGFGAEKPLAPNTTEEGKARNRRVEITIMDR
ncbi:MAG: OmpA family protein [Treponema sp.]|nr:OmpA family protein [Treponema sp.]